MTTKAPPEAAPVALPDLPRATVLPAAGEGDPLTLEADTEERHGDLYQLSGDVEITARGHTVRADRITYDAGTGNLTLDGHIHITGGANDESLDAARGNYNLNTETGRFYDVHGSVGMANFGKRASAPYATPQSTNPLLFEGRMVVKTGPVDYDIYDGKVTSCMLPDPDWMLSAGHFSLDGDKARAYKSTFRLRRIPILFLPYVTHPLAPEERQSGFTTPVPNYSNTKGFIIGEDVYLVFGRSADLTVGSQYFSARGFEESATFRYRGREQDFATAHFNALQDRGYVDSHTGLYINQGGEDVTTAFRRQLTPHTRVVGDAEYLSSYVYREAFNENFNQAVSSDITSILYAIHERNGYSTSVRADRYQGLKRVQTTTFNAQDVAVTTPGQEVRIFHAPSVDFTALDHHLGSTPLLWSVESSAAGLKRTQPNFTSSGIIERLDLRPELSLPLAGGGWHTLSSIAVRETVYSRSRLQPYPANTPPIELTQPINRSSLEATVDIRPPVIERTFHPPPLLAHIFGTEVRHAIEPQFVYRNVSGISNFLGILRFDDVDVDSNTNELQYGVTQRLFATHPPVPRAPRNCVAATPRAGVAFEEGAEDPRESEAPSGLDANGIPTPEAAPVPARSHAHAAANACPPAETQPQEWLSWTLAQKHFFDPIFGNAVIAGRRNIFSTTLDLSGIAFLTEARDISPLTSKLRMRTTAHTDFEWDFDLDTGAKRFTRSNIFVDAHEGPYFGAVSYARLNAPGRSYTENIDANGADTLTPSATSDFSQMRLLLGYGNALKPGFSIAANANLDLKLGSLQYGALQGSYNWNCCGLAVEYRKYELGSVRNEGTERFSFTLVNIGTAGNLRKSQRLF